MMTIMREKLMSAYGLEDFELIPGTEVSMTAELANAIQKRKWIVVLGWTPHWKFGRWALKFLDDPKNIWGGAGKIHTLVRKGLKEDMPDVYKFLDNFNWKPEDMERLLLWNQMGGNPYDNAKRWMRANPTIVESWLK
jgi:glycine betaine/proline transport system substrate-binding protein